MAFWIDPFLLLAIGMVLAALAKHAAPQNPHFVPVVGALTMLVTYSIAIGLFVNFEFLEPIWVTLGAETGTEFMLNGVILSIAESGLVWQDLSGTQLFVSILIFTTYPVYLATGIALGRITFGRTPAQEGVVGLVRP
jgi:hypothetical protein